MAMKVCVIKNISESGEEDWAVALSEKGIEFDIVEISDSDWMNRATKNEYDLYLVKPHSTLSLHKQLFDERIYLLNKVKCKCIYPSLNELLVYENKRVLSDWLKHFRIPHPRTFVFANEKEASDFLESSPLPLVGKANIGAAGSGVHIIRSLREGKRIIRSAFRGNGVPRRFGPNLRRKGAANAILGKICDPRFVLRRLSEYRAVAQDSSRGFLILQEFIGHDFEWRVVRIGSSFFAHKKLAFAEKASGTKKKEFLNPPESLLQFTKDITDEMGFSCVSVDIFEDSERGYLVNEVQTYFGQSYDYLAAIDGRPGRFLEKDGKWVFEEGDFNRNHSYNLRLEHALEQYRAGLL